MTDAKRYEDAICRQDAKEQSEKRRERLAELFRDVEERTMTDQERQFRAAYRRLSRPQAQAIFELMVCWRDGTGPDVAEVTELT